MQIRRVLAVAMVALLAATSTAQAHTYPHHMLRKIHRNRDAVWRIQDKMDAPHTPYRHWAERHCKNKHCRYVILEKWRKRHRYWKTLYAHIGTAVSAHAVVGSVRSNLLCIHSHEGAWNANTGNGYYGGLQMDYSFMQTYGGSYLSAYGTADKWPIEDQLRAGARAVASRGYSPWPNTAAMCGLL